MLICLLKEIFFYGKIRGVEKRLFMLNRNLKHEVNPYQKKFKKRLLLSLLIVSILSVGGLLIVKEVNKAEPYVSKYNVCNMLQEDIIERFEDYTFNDVQGMSDYFFYGETFNLFEETYEVSSVNNLVGKTLLLTNICNNEEYHYLIDTDVNGQIPLENLPVGFYEVYINIDMVKKRVVMNETTVDSLILVTRNNLDRKVEVIGDRTIFDDNDHTNLLDKNYLFLNVEQLSEPSIAYDVVIDPSLGVNASGYFDDYGKSNLGLVEADELFSMAEIIRDELEAAGLKVLITRDDNEHIINSYGVGGRLDKAYKSNAKYYLELGFNNAGEGALKIYKSSFVSNNFSTFISNYLLDNTVLLKSKGPTVISATRYNGLDGVINIRETGGKALGAATYSELSREQNGSFAYRNTHAMESISIEYLNFTNEQQLEEFKVNKESYAKATANALLEYFKLGVQNNDISD